MADRTALQIVNFARTLIGIYDRKALRDGFASDELQGDVDILSNVNEGIRELLETGYSQCYFTLTLDKEDSDDFPYEYGLDRQIHEIVDVRLGSTGFELALTSIGSLNIDRPGWRSASRGTPTNYYLTGHVLGIYPKPLLTTETVEILANALVDDLSAAADVPSRLPEAFHMIPAWYAASIICAGQPGEEMQSKSANYMGEFLKKKEKLQEWVQARHVSDTDRRFRVSEPRRRRPWGYR